MKSADSLEWQRIRGDAEVMAIHTGHDSPALSTLINTQHGVLTAAQAKAGGLPHETLRRRVQRGLWQRLVPGVYALQGSPPSRLQWLVAAQLYAGEQLRAHRARRRWPCTGSGLPRDPDRRARGLRRAGLEYACGEPSRYRLDTLVPHGRRRQSVGQLRIIRTTRVPEATRIGALRVAPLARSVVDGSGRRRGQRARGDRRHRDGGPGGRPGAADRARTRARQGPASSTRPRSVPSSANREPTSESRQRAISWRCSTRPGRSARCRTSRSTSVSVAWPRPWRYGRIEPWRSWRTRHRWTWERSRRWASGLSR